MAHLLFYSTGRNVPFFTGLQQNNGYGNQEQYDIGQQAQQSVYKGDEGVEQHNDSHRDNRRQHDYTEQQNQAGSEEILHVI